MCFKEYFFQKRNCLQKQNKTTFRADESFILGTNVLKQFCCNFTPAHLWPLCRFSHLKSWFLNRVSNRRKQHRTASDCSKILLPTFCALFTECTSYEMHPKTPQFLANIIPDSSSLSGVSLPRTFADIHQFIQTSLSTCLPYAVNNRYKNLLTTKILKYGAVFVCVHELEFK